MKDWATLRDDTPEMTEKIEEIAVEFVNLYSKKEF